MITKDYAAENNLAIDHGALLSAEEGAEAVIADSPAAKAGLLKGDVIIKVDGEELSEERSLSQVVREHMPGDSLVMIIWRDGAEKEISVVLEEYQEE
jgi:serine protease Do